MTPSTQAKLDALRDGSPGGSHYRRRGGVQPIDLIEAQQLGPHEAAIIGYVTRWRDKNGVADLQKAKWYLDRLLLLAAAAEDRIIDAARSAGARVEDEIAAYNDGYKGWCE